MHSRQGGYILAALAAVSEFGTEVFGNINSITGDNIIDPVHMRSVWKGVKEISK
jgi:hypothetical protein